MKISVVASNLQIIFLLRYKSYKNVNTKEEENIVSWNSGLWCGRSRSLCLFSELDPAQGFKRPHRHEGLRRGRGRRFEPQST